jgi:hypothetical protein
VQHQVLDECCIGAIGGSTKLRQPAGQAAHPPPPPGDGMLVFPVNGMRKARHFVQRCQSPGAQRIRDLSIWSLKCKRYWIVYI